MNAKLTCDPAALAAGIKTNIAALEADAAVLTPLLGYALTNLRGAHNAVEGHLKKLADDDAAAATAAQAAVNAAE